MPAWQQSIDSCAEGVSVCSTHICVGVSAPEREGRAGGQRAVLHLDVHKGQHVGHHLPQTTWPGRQDSR